EYLELPPRIDMTHSVDLPKLAEDQYRELERELIVELEREQVIARSAAALTNKLAQMSNGAVITDSETGTVTEIHDEKFKALDDLLETYPTENLLIAYSFVADRDRLLARYPDAVFLDQNEQTIHDWNSGKIRILVAHPVSCGEGLNLQHGGATIVWFGLGWALGPYLQFNGRLHRQGQTKTVKVIHLLTRDCIDEKIYSAIQNKAETQNELLLSLRESLK
ncbi:MAG: DEAD/DEAH box helicase, partial [Methylomicrobium sp.]|nr:DEAD/DEAH box helicase [Methylomicrobium sp.]